MSASNRASRITKLHTALKKQYKPIPSADRPLMEHLLYACLLEDAPADLADEALARLEQDFFDWNEVRVTTITEISEVLAHLPAPVAAATRLKRCLQGAFETFYSFEIDELKKQNLGSAVTQFQSLPGMTPFVLAYITQHGLGGHAIPVDTGAMRLMHACDIVNDSERDAGKVPGLERAIPKNKGIEFGSLLHQAGVALMQDPQDKSVVAVIKAVNKDGLKRLEEATEERRAAYERQQEAASEEEAETTEADEAAEKAGGEKKTADSKSAGKKAAKKSATTKSAKPKTAEKKSAKKPAASKSDTKKKSAGKSSDKKSKAKPKAAKSGSGSKSSSKRLAKRKPR